MNQNEEKERKGKGHLPFGQIILDDMFLLLLLGITVPFIIYLVWGYIDLASLPPMPEPEFTTTVSGQVPNTTQLDAAQLVNARGCIGCHSIDGSARVGPSWMGLWGADRELTDGSVIRVDEAYLKRAILDPDAEVAVGQSAGLMPKYQDQLSADEVQAIVDYIRELQ